jgi:hypothetical protein
MNGKHSAHAALSFAIVFCGCLSAQITADLKGTVTDPAGASVPNAKITVTSTETGESRVVPADVEGRFAANQLKIGSYQVKVEATGFRSAVTDALLRSGETTAVSFKMEVGQVSESVTVTDAVSALDTTNAQIQVSFEAAQVMELPVNRNPLLFASSSPGVTPVTANNPFLSQGHYNANGGRGRGNNITVDNITASDISNTGNGGNQLGPLNFASIKEVKVITNNFSAEYGRNASSQLQFITKSGTNEFHGEVYEFLKNSEFNARDFFDRSGGPAITRQNEFGYVLGGPILRNKTHFFTSYEGLQLRGSGAVRIANVPTPEQLTAVSDPTSKKLLDQYKLPAATTIGPQNGQVPQSANSFTKAPLALSFRIDHQFSDKDSINGRYSQYSSEAGSTGNTFISTNLANFGATSKNAPRQANLAETHLFSPTVVNEFRFGFGRSSPVFAIDSTVPLGPRVQFANNQIDRFGAWDGLPQGRIQNTFQYNDTVSWVRGAHNFKFGVDIYRYQLNSFLDSSVRGFFTFADWTDFAAGRPNNYTQLFGSTLRGNRVLNHHYFVQDDWKVTRSLTLNIGLRAEVTHGTTEVNGIISNLDLGCRDSLGAAGTGPFGCFVIGKPSNDRQTNWGPRFGFAWSPGAQGKTVIRGGYGIAYDFLFLNPITNQRSLPPFIANGTLSGVASFTGANSYANLVAGTSALQRETATQVGVLNPTLRNYGNVNPAIDRNLRNPMVQQWSLGVQREVWKDLVLKATYVGTKGDHLQRSQPRNLINDPRASPATSLADETARLAGFQAANAAQNGSATTPSNRIDPRFNNVSLLESSASSIYHAFEFLALKNFGQGFYMQTGYTFGKSIDNGSDALGVLINDSPLAQNPRDQRAERSVSQFDVNQRLVITHRWEPTWGSGVSSPVLRHLVRGWGFSGISSFRSGFPVTFEAGGRRGITPLSFTGSGTGQPVRPNAAGPFKFDPIPSGRAGAPNTLNADIQPISTFAANLGLSQPLLGNFGTLGRNTHRLNGAKNFDWTISKNFVVTERIKLQVRGEFYNIFNNVAFQDVNRNISGATFGQYTTVTQDSRNIQLGARVVF